MKQLMFNRIEQLMGIESASAHCDIPCKIYDPSKAQIAALSIIRFLDLIQELSSKAQLSVADQAQVMRLVREKEIHASIVKEEIRVIWGDYFKQPQFDMFPDIHHLVHTIMMTASQCKQHIDRDKGKALLTLVNQFADAFWKTKGVETFVATCPYPPSEQVTYPNLAQ